MLDSHDWVRLRCFEYELQKLELQNKEPIIRAWLEVEIEKLKEKLNDS